MPQFSGIPVAYRRFYVFGDSRLADERHTDPLLFYCKWKKSLAAFTPQKGEYYWENTWKLQESLAMIE
jgi:hypothetical protein